MKIEKTNCHAFYPILFGTSAAFLVSTISNRIFNKNLRFSLGVGALTGTAISLLSIRCKASSPPPRKWSEWEQKTAQHLRLRSIDETVIKTLDENNLQPFSLAFWRSMDYKPSTDQTCITLKSGESFTYYDSIPVEKLVFSKKEVENFDPLKANRKLTSYKAFNFLEDSKKYYVLSKDEPSCLKYLQEGN